MLAQSQMHTLRHTQTRAQEQRHAHGHTYRTHTGRCIRAVYRIDANVRKGSIRHNRQNIQGCTELTKDCNTGCTTSNQSKQQIGAVCSLQSRLAPAASLQTQSSTELLASGRICQNNHCSTCLRKRLWVAFLACSPRASRMRHKKEKKIRVRLTRLRSRVRLTSG